MLKFIAALLVGASVFLTPIKSEAYGIADSFTYNNAPTHVKHEQRRYVNQTRRHRVISRPAIASYSVSSRGARPRAWCGWYMRQIKGGDASFNVARNWLKYGKPTVPSYGAVVVWPHHVGYIVDRDHRGWIVRSGNWNNRVADVPLSRMGKPIAFRN